MKAYTKPCSLAIILILLCLLLTDISALADTVLFRVRTGEDGVSLRSAPSVDAYKIRGIHAYYELDVYEERDGWYKVYYKGDWGWVIGSKVTVIKRNINSTPSKRPPTPKSTSHGATIVFDSDYLASVAVNANQSISTRTGPSTQYDEPGTFSKDLSYTALSKAWDSRNGIWWIQVAFKSNGRVYCGYTGQKRFSNLNVSRLPEEKIIGHCRINGPIEAWYAPGFNAAAVKRAVPEGVYCDIYALVRYEESDFIQIEFYDSGIGKQRRVWVKDWAVDDYVMYYGFS